MSGIMRASGGVDFPLWTIAGTEIRYFFARPWSLRLAALTIPAVWLVVWPHTPSPFIPLFAALFAGLEPEYGNIFFRWPNEFEALCLLPVSWERVIRAKNLATVVLTLACFALMSTVVLYYAPVTPGFDDFRDALLYLSSVLFPLLHAGNLQSLQHPRRRIGGRLDDLAGAVIMAGTAAVLSLPFVILVPLLKAPLLCLAYSSATAVFWWKVSTRDLAQRIMRDKGVVCTAA